MANKIARLFLPIIAVTIFFVIGISYSAKEPITGSLIMADFFLAAVIVLLVDKIINRLKKQK
jgi:ethanolamine transporter EutH